MLALFVIPTAVEESLILKITARDVSTSLDMTKEARGTVRVDP
jgi:hypothetical protein